MKDKADLIITNNPHVKAAYEEYERNGTELTLRGDLFRALNNESKINNNLGEL